jgi:hypothetical protein
MKRTLRLVAGATALMLGLIGASTATARQRHEPLKGEGQGLKLIANVPYDGGTDMEITTIRGRDYAFTGSAPGVGGAKAGAMRVIDVTNPAKPKLVATLKCSLYQMDIQISHDKKTLILGADRAGGSDGCLMLGRAGFMTVDISNPRKPRAIGAAPIDRGSHNITAHPTKPIVYNSDSDGSGLNSEIQIWSIANPRKPKLINSVASYPAAPHDISFNKKGTLAVTAAVRHFSIFNTKNPKKPVLLWEGQCPGCTITHDAKFTPNGKRIIIGDEANGGGTFACPGGALYFYDLMGSADQPVPVLTGVYEPGEVVFGAEQSVGSCTSHVFDISDNGKHIAISWYGAGTRYLDIRESHGLSFGANNSPGAAREVAWFIPKGGSSWSSKFHKGPYIFSNDINRGLDVYKITAK